MMRQLSVLLTCLMAGTAFGQTLVVNTRLQSQEILDRDEMLQLDLREYFQTYDSPGPVATFTINMPVPKGVHRLTTDGTLDPDEFADDQRPQIMTYELLSGGSYSDPYDVPASDFLWETHEVQFQLIPGEAPISVANFITYAKDGAYVDTIVHRNESTGRVFRSGGQANFNPLPLIQSGGFRLYQGGDFLLEWIPTRPSIVLEESRANTKGTIAFARSAINLNSAASQFFINLEDNTNSFGTAYAVFGELLNPEQDQPVLDTFADAPVYDLSGVTSSGTPNVFPTLPFTTIPLYSPIWDDQDSYSRISSIVVADGGKEGITYSWDFVNAEDPDNGPTENELANRTSFDIQLNGPDLIVNRVDTGAVRIRVTGTDGSTTASFEADVVAYNPAALDQFPSSIIATGGWLDNAWFGWVAAEDIPLIRHLNHGYQFVDESSTPTVLYLYDYNLETWLYTTSAIYPTLYNFGLDKWLFYTEGSGDGFSELRWFWLYDGDNSRWVTEDQI